MANRDAPFGFGVWGKCLHTGIYAVGTAPTLNFFHQDMVASLNSGIATTKYGTIPAAKIASVIVTREGDSYPLFGSITSIFDEKGEPLLYIAAGRVGDGTVAGYLEIADDPMQQFVAQANATVAAADIDLNYGITSPSVSLGNTNTGISLQQITVSTAGTNVDQYLRLLGMAYPDQDSLTGAGSRWICQINPECHYFGASAAV